MSSKQINILKHASGGGVVKRPIVDAAAEAQRIIAAAEAEAEALRQGAEMSAREAREAGYREGYEAALSQLSEDLLAAREGRKAALASAERDLLRLAVKIAEKIIGREIEADRATLVDMVAAALGHARRQEVLTVRVNPEALAAARAHADRLEAGGRARLLDFVADPRLELGGCVIETDAGSVDAQLATQLRVLERALLERAAEGGR